MTGPRVYVHGHRIHHGLAGALLTILGALLAWHDRHDWPWPLTDPPAPSSSNSTGRHHPASP